jgi:hypothetical protein
MSEGSDGFVVGLIVGLFAMGIIETCIPGIGWHDARISKDYCEKSLPRDQVCIANYIPSAIKDHQP